MGQCILENKINHSKAREQFRNTYYFCDLLEKASVGMKTSGIICGHCCLKIQRVGECIAELIFRKTITYEQLDRDPRCFAEYLPEDLKEYVNCVSKLTGKEWEAMRGICNRCTPRPVEPQELPRVEATSMDTIARREV